MWYISQIRLILTDTTAKLSAHPHVYDLFQMVFIIFTATHLVACGYYTFTLYEGFAPALIASMAQVSPVMTGGFPPSPSLGMSARHKVQHHPIQSNIPPSSNFETSIIVICRFRKRSSTPGFCLSHSDLYHYSYTTTAHITKPD